MLVRLHFRWVANYAAITAIVFFFTHLLLFIIFDCFMAAHMESVQMYAAHSVFVHGQLY